MDRLTRRSENGIYIVATNIQKAFEKLADYEDTGLTPEEIERIKNNVQPM